MKKLFNILLISMSYLFMTGCNNPEGKFLINSSEMGLGGWILLGLAISIIPISIYFMKNPIKRKPK